MKQTINVTFDTSIFDSNQLDLSDGSSFSQLQKYSERGRVRVFLSNIVLKEMENHCIEYADRICSKIRKTRDAILKGEFENISNNKSSHQISEGFIKAIQLSYILDIPKKASAEELAINYLRNYIDSLHIKLLNSKKVDIDNIFSSYFHKEPPFEDSEKKKYEFPDAVIAAQIQAEFNVENPVYVLTTDKGLTRALKDSPYCTIVSSLGKLFDEISKSENEYHTVCDTIEKILPEINNIIEMDLDDDTNISLEGMRYDSDGSVSGYDYDEIYYSTCQLNSTLFAVDYFDEEKIGARLRCTAIIEADCSYYDYEHAVWDSEEKEYLFLNTVNNIEKHKANFPCEVRINRKDNSIDSIKFHVFLGGDSLLKRHVNAPSPKAYNTCPDCGEKICFENDGGNGFCINCAPNH